MTGHIYLVGVLLLYSGQVHAACTELLHKKYVCEKTNSSEIERLPHDIHYLQILDTPMNITRLLFPFAATLQYLELSNCGVFEIEDAVLSEFKSLKELKILVNQLTTLNASWFKDIDNLQLLDLSNSNLRNCVDVERFADLKHLKAVNLYLSPDFDKSCRDTIRHIVYGDCFERWLGWYDCKNVTLDDIRKLPDDLTGLNITSTLINKITKSLFSRFASTIRCLKCDNCSITSIEDDVLSEMRDLRAIVLRYNELNEIKATYFKNMGNLEYLDLQNNSINNIEDNAMSELRSLNVLNLANNQLKRINATSFDKAFNLRELSLKNNGIEGIESRVVLHMMNLTSLDLSNNKLQCIDFIALSVLRSGLHLNGYGYPLWTEECNAETGITGPW